jgi:hypothetical protein
VRQLQLAWAVHDGQDCLRVRGWMSAELGDLAARADQLLALLPEDLINVRSSVASLQPVAGHFAVKHDTVWFRPRFPFLGGHTYALLVADGSARWHDEGAERWTLRRPRRLGVESTLVVAIHPTADEVPLNLLKLYVEFSAPMSEGCAQASISIRRAGDRTPIDFVFAPMEPELWDPAHRRLTVLLDPGRIKRGLLPNIEAGYPLKEGERITVCVDDAFRDAAGYRLAAPFERSYVVGPALRERVTPEAWQLRVPSAGTREPFHVVFDRPLDHGLVNHALRIFDDHGTLVLGRGDVAVGDGGWSYTPLQPWDAGRHRLVADRRLEDLAGNSVERVFDRDLTRDALAEPNAGVLEWIVD